ncbi:MAG: hypothetical protein WAO58_04485 [Fimbriimonadaceae bacterium]
MSLRPILLSALAAFVLLTSSGCGERGPDTRFVGTYKHTLATGSVALELRSDMKFILTQGAAAKKSTGTYKIKGETVTLIVEEIDGQAAKPADREYPIALTLIEGGVLKGPGQLVLKKQ